MKRALGVATSLLVLAVAPHAAAQGEPPPPLPPPTPPPAAPAPASAPASAAAPAPASASAPAAAPAPASAEPSPPAPAPKPVADARTGFQLALRTGVAIPMGKLQSGTAMYDVFSPQVPIQVDIGWKVIPHLFLGVYLGVAVGGVNNKLADLCDRTNADCGSATFMAGLEAQYAFAPSHKINPWIGYGLGFEGSGVGNTVGNSTTTTAWSGFDFARLTGGFDVRLTRVFGIGPLVDLTFGRYGHTTVKLERTTQIDDSIDDKRVHAWLTIGGRVIFFP